MTTEEKILKSALKLFVKNGFSASTASICKAAKVSTGSLFNHYSTKDDLIVNLYLRVLDDYYKDALAYLLDNSETLDYWNKVAHICDIQLDWCLDNWDEFRYMRMFENSPFINRSTVERNENYIKRDTFITESATLAIANKDVIDMPIEFLLNYGASTISTVASYLHNHPEKRANSDFRWRIWKRFILKAERPKA